MKSHGFVWELGLELGRGDLNWIHVRIFTKIAGLNPLKRKLVK